jgi:uncharacterized integral membrane protein (TIGR00697 family)
MDRPSLSLYVYLALAFVAGLITANLISGKIVALGGLFVPAGVLAYSITFAMTDTICEVWGRERTQLVVNAGFVVQLLVWLLVLLAIHLPAAPFWQGQEAYRQVLGAGNVVIFASLIAYAISQTFDVWAFNRIKRLSGGRHLWLRNNLSTVLSQLIDTVVFISIFAYFLGLNPWPLIAGQLVVKWIIALLDTPVVYALVYLVRRRVGPAVNPDALSA